MADADWVMVTMESVSTRGQTDGRDNTEANHECEIWAEGDDGTLSWKRCTKNVGHKQFIPASTFSLEHLPDVYKDKELLKLIGHLIALTVRVRVGCVSQHRPQDYVFGRYRGSKLTHTGSGFVTRADLFSSEISSCPCTDCVVSPDPCRKWWSLWVRTARHVVYDTQEAASTLVDVGYDDGNDKDKTTTNMQTLSGVRVCGGEVADDWCEMECVTHDLDLGKELDNVREAFNTLRKKLNESHAAGGSYSPVTVIISHPHGCPKKVTVGEWRERTVVKTGHESYGMESTDYTYTTHTCKGSSGAPVLTLGQRGGEGWVYGPQWYHPHSGCDKLGVGKSAVGYDNITHSKD